MGLSPKVSSPTPQGVKHTRSPSNFIKNLYNMISSPNNKEITWLPSGDGFVICGSVEEFERKTLPLYFRHGRYQSFARQLCFYSFKRVSRKRNRSVYKRLWFHRDFPNDLGKVRRRTSPVAEEDSPLMILSTQGQRHSEIGSSQLVEHPKVASTPNNLEGNKPSFVTPTGRVEKTTPIDVSMLHNDYDSDEHDDLVYSISNQLYKNAQSSSGNYGRRRPGVVTPPFHSLCSSNSSSDLLLTYEDEVCQVLGYGIANPTPNKSVRVYGTLSEPPPLASFETIQRIASVIRKSNFNRAEIASALVSFVLMAHTDETSLPKKAKLILRSNSDLKCEFMDHYRQALDPSACMESDWDEGSTYGKTVARDFCVFSVNCLRGFVETCELDDARLLAAALDFMQSSIWSST